MATVGAIDNNQLLSTTNTVQFDLLGVGAANTTGALYVARSNRIGIYVSGTSVSTGSDTDGIFVDTSFAPSSNVTNAAAIGLFPTFNPPGGVTISNAYGLYVAAGTQGGAGAVTTGYGLFVTAPSFGTANKAASIGGLVVDSGGTGTISAGVWSGTAIVVAKGGTGQTTLTAHSVLVGNGTTAISQVSPSATVGAPLLSAGASADPSYSTSLAVLDALNITNQTGTSNNVGFQVNNNSNTAGKNAFVQVNTAGTSAGNALYQASNGVDTIWSWGITSATNSAFHLSASNTVGTGDVMVAQTTGEINFPLQTSFMAFQASVASNVSGTGGTYTLGTTVDLTEVFDQNADFDPTSGVFTSPVTGRYMLGMQVYWNGLTVATTFNNIITTSNRSYNNALGRTASATDNTNSTSVLADMDAADTCTFVAAVSGEAGATADVFGTDTNPFTYCYGQLEC